MKTRDLITALLLADKKYHRRIDAALQERHTMTRLGMVLDDLLAEYREAQRKSGQYTDMDGMTNDPEYRECFEVAISEDAGGIFDAWRAGPDMALSRLNACIKEEYNEQEPEWRAKLDEGRRVNNNVDEARGK